MKNFLFQVGWQHSFLMSALCVPNMDCLWLEYLPVSKDITNPLWKRMENLFYKGFKSFKLLLFQNESTLSKFKFLSWKKIFLVFTLIGKKLQNKIHIKINGDVLNYFWMKQDFFNIVLELVVRLCLPHLGKWDKSVTFCLLLEK